MASTYVQFPGIPGTSQKPGRAAWIEVLSYRDTTNTPKVEPGPPEPPGLLTPEPAPPSRPDPLRGGQLTVRKELDAASKPLHDAQGIRHFDKVVIEVAQFDAATQKEAVHTTRTYLEVYLVRMNVTSTHEELLLSYSRLEWTKSKAGEADASKEPSKPPQSPPAGTPERAFLQVPGIPGEVKEAPHSGWIGLLNVELHPSGAGVGRQMVNDRGRPSHVEPAPTSAHGALTVTKRTDSATSKLRAAFEAQTHFALLVVDIPHASGTHRLTLQNALIVTIQTRSTPTRPPALGPQPIQEVITLSYDRVERDLQAPPRKPAAHPVTRANMLAVSERSTINLRPPKFFELALPVLSGENGKRIYPPLGATLRLTSQRGYDRSYSAAEGMVTDDDYCSFRFYDISEKATDELFTATLEAGGETETIFKDRRVATYIQAARKKGDYETAFSPADGKQTAPRGDELLPSADTEAGAA